MVNNQLTLIQNLNHKNMQAGHVSVTMDRVIHAIRTWLKYSFDDFKDKGLNVHATN